MSNFVLITCLKENPRDITQETSMPPKKFIARLFEYIRRKFTKTAVQEENTLMSIQANVKEIELSEGMSVFLIHFLYDPEMMNQKMKEIDEFVTTFSNNNNVKCIIVSDDLKGKINAAWISNDAFNGRILYLALLVDILDGIYSNKGIKIGDLDITIIHGKSNGELFSIISLLSPVIRYMTVITDRKDDLEHEIDRIYDETGLSVSLSTDSKAALRNTDVIIHLGQPAWINDSKLNNRAFIINYDIFSSKSITKENIVINGIVAGFPVKLLQKFDKDIVNSFRTCNLPEIVLCNKTGVSNPQSAINSYILIKIKNEFKKDGYKILALEGRHNSMRFDQMQ